MFEQERKKFFEIKEKIEKGRKAVEEFERALEILVKRYNTANRENRFIVGGALELLFAALLRYLGFKCERMQERRFDLNIDGLLFSVKSNFTGSGAIRLINVLGREEVSWAEPTLFFISNVGIIYADPEMGLETKHVGDALTINTLEVLKVVQRYPDFLIKIRIPKKEKLKGQARTASHDVAENILREVGTTLLDFLP